MLFCEVVAVTVSLWTRDCHLWSSLSISHNGRRLAGGCKSILLLFHPPTCLLTHLSVLHSASPWHLLTHPTYPMATVHSSAQCSHLQFLLAGLLNWNWNHYNRRHELTTWNSIFHHFSYLDWLITSGWEVLKRDLLLVLKMPLSGRILPCLKKNYLNSA